MRGRSVVVLLLLSLAGLAGCKDSETSDPPSQQTPDAGASQNQPGATTAPVVSFPTMQPEATAPSTTSDPAAVAAQPWVQSLPPAGDSPSAVPSAQAGTDSWTGTSGSGLSATPYEPVGSGTTPSAGPSLSTPGVPETVTSEPWPAANPAAETFPVDAQADLASTLPGDTPATTSGKVRVSSSDVQAGSVAASVKNRIPTAAQEDSTTKAVPRSYIPSDVAVSEWPNTADAASSAGTTGPQATAPVAEPFSVAPTTEASTMAPEASAVADPSIAPADASSAGGVTTSATPYMRASDDGTYTLVKVFYGTDRASVGSGSGGATGTSKGLLYVLMGVFALLTLGLALAAFRLPRTRLLLTSSFGCLILTVVLGVVSASGGLSSTGDEQAVRQYGADRGELEMGTCEVSVPLEHEVGEVESPSIFKLEFTQNPERHVVLMGVTQEDPDAFYQGLHQCIDQCSHKEAFVFVHGYNVTFEDAARRTAQIAYDLKFEGAPIFYSWPSQGGLTGYTIDETNVVWTVPHLKEFLVGVAQKSGAESVHVVAHSMGNRAVTSALRELAYEMPDEHPLFKEVLLTAPDVDADVFRRDLAPAIVKTAKRVTLYASSNDEALVVSKQVHGYPRAGESGDQLVVIDGVDTIDVSEIDTSLVGHSYYGSNETVMSDIYDVMHSDNPPDLRKSLRAMRLGQLKYWMFLR